MSTFYSSPKKLDVFWDLFLMHSHWTYLCQGNWDGWKWGKFLTLQNFIMKIMERMPDIEPYMVQEKKRVVMEAPTPKGEIKEDISLSLWSFSPMKYCMYIFLLKGHPRMSRTYVASIPQKGKKTALPNNTIRWTFFLLIRDPDSRPGDSLSRPLYSALIYRKHNWLCPFSTFGLGCERKISGLLDKTKNNKLKALVYVSTKCPVCVPNIVGPLEMPIFWFSFFWAKDFIFWKFRSL